MYKIPLIEVKEKIVASGKIVAEELEEKIKTKINELSGLISEEGAAHIIANELAIKLIKDTEEKLKIKELYIGMRSVSVVGKVVRKFEVREFNRNGKVGKVCSLVLADETDTIRVVFWNDQVEVLANLKEDDIVLLKEVYVKENNGGKELHFADRGHLEINPPGITITTIREPTIFQRDLQKEYVRKEIVKLQSDEKNIELMGTVVQVFDPRFFLMHPETGKRLSGTEEGLIPRLSYVMNLVLDDGSGNIRCVFWKNQTNHLLNKTDQEVIQYKDGAVSFDDLKTELLGEQLKLRGRVKHNEMFQRLEFNVDFVEKADPEEELKRLEHGLESVD